MPATETYTDNVSGTQRQISYALTSDQKNVASSSVQYRAGATLPWSPWKTKSFTYDGNGRVKQTTLSWSPGTPPQPGAVTSTTS